MKRLGIVVLLAACGENGSPAAPDAHAVEPDATAVPLIAGECKEHVTLYGMDNTAGSHVVGPLALDTQGTTLCLTLDARDNLVVGHFGAGGDREPATTSTFQMALFTADGTLLQEGWDVTFGGSPPTTFANLEYGVTKGTILEAKLVAAARAGTATTSLYMDLFEPYE